MGINDNLIEDYRCVITNTILSNETVVKVLSNDQLSIETADELLWNHLIPQQYVPETIDETGSYIMYDIDENVLYSTRSKNSTYTELTLYIWILTHKDMPLYKGKLRNDILSREIKYMFNETDTSKLGIAKNHLSSNKVFTSPNCKYMGRILTFNVTDWSDTVRLKE